MRIGGIETGVSGLASTLASNFGFVVLFMAVIFIMFIFNGVVSEAQIHSDGSIHYRIKYIGRAAVESEGRK